MIINIKCQPLHTVHKAELYLQKSIQGSVIVVEKENNSSNGINTGLYSEKYHTQA